MSVVQPVCELLELLIHPESDGVVTEGATGFDDVPIFLLLDDLLQLQPQGNLAQVRVNAWEVDTIFHINEHKTGIFCLYTYSYTQDNILILVLDTMTNIVCACIPQRG